MSKTLIASLIALGGVVFAMPSSSAAPTSPMPAAPSAASSNFVQIDYAGGRYHCHGPRRNGDCHGGYRRSERHQGYYAPRYGYYRSPYRSYGGPGITLRFGSAPRYRYHRDYR